MDNTEKIKVIEFENKINMDNFNIKEAIERGCKKKTKYWYANRDNCLLIGEDLPLHTNDYALIEKEFQINIIEE